MSNVDISRSVFISFVVLFDIPAFEEMCKIIQLLAKSLFEFLSTAAVSAAREVMKSKEVKVSPENSALKMPPFLQSENFPLHDLGTKQV